MAVSNEFLQLMDKLKGHKELLDYSSCNSETSFHPNKCHVCNCFGAEVNLKRCGACGMISYCNKDHQAEDWLNHKVFCKALRQIKKEWETDNLYKSLQSSGATDPMGKLLSRFKDLSVGKALMQVSNLFTDMKDRRSIDFIDRLMDKAVEVLGRPLKLYEIQIINNPRLCCVCYESDQQQLTNCPKCPETSFCQKHLNDPSHDSNCFKNLSIFYAPSGMYSKIPPSIKNIIDDMKLPVQTETSKLPNSLTKFFERYFSKVSFDTFPLEKRVEFNSYFSEKLSAPLTILFAMEKLGLNLESMVIHVIGASTSEQTFLDWETILHYLPQLRRLKLILIGLELLSPGSVKIQKECKLCKNSKRELIFETKVMEYQKYCSSKNFEKPDMIVCLNAGLYAYPTWGKGIEACDKGKCPFLVTDYHQKEGADDKRIIESKFPSADCIYSDLNPFSSLFFRRSNIFLGPSSANQFVTIYKLLGPVKISK